MATYYFRSTGTNWNTPGDWSSTPSPTYTAGAVPLVTDDVVFEAASANCIVNASARVCKSINFTLYTNTITMTFGITVSGDITLGVSMGIAGTGTLIIGATSTYTSNGVTWPNTLQLGVGPSITITLASLITTVQNLSNTGGSTAIITTVNGNTLNILGNLSNAVILAGSTQINLIGTGTWNSQNIGVEVRTKLNINTLGTITRGVNGYAYSGPELKYTQGNLANGTALLRLSAAGNTLSIISNGVNWGNVFILASTTTLTDDMNINDFVFSGSNAVINGSNLRINGNLSSTTTAIITGTTVFQIIGTGNQTWTTLIATTRIGNSMNIDKVSGTFTLSSANIAYGSATAVLTYTQGTFVPGTSTFLTQAGTTFSIIGSGFSLYNWNPVAGTYTINTNPLIINNSLTLAGATTFAGAFGWDCNNLICPTAGPYSITLKEGVTYRTRTGVSITGGTAANRVTMQSSSGSIRAIWTLNFGATQSMIYVNGTRIDSSGEQTVWSFGVSAANVSTSINWNPGVPLRTVAYIFVN